VIKKPVYDPQTDGNVFDWILGAASSVRELRRIEREAIEKAAAESKELDEAKVEN